MPRNVGESVNARLRDVARRTGTDMLSLQTRYALERLLFRLSVGPWRARVALKGALIFLVHHGDVHRPTADVDLNGIDADGSSSMAVAMVRQACEEIVEDDGVLFDASTLDVRKERDWSRTPGGKVELDARIHASRVRVRVDMGYGNPVIPDARWCEYPTILPGSRVPRILVCPFETMIAEKLHAMVRHGAETTRLRDYYDLWSLATERSFSLPVLGKATRATFEAAGDPLPLLPLDGLSEDFVRLSDRNWDRFRRSAGLRRVAPPMRETLEVLTPFLSRVVSHARDPEIAPAEVWRPAEEAACRESVPSPV